MRTSQYLIYPFLTLLATSITAQSQQQQNAAIPAVMDTQAAALIPKALSALNGSTTVTDVILTGTVTRVSGSDTESGTITMKALGNKLSRMDMSLSDGQWTEIRGVDPAGTPKSIWSDPDGAVHSIAAHNAMTDAVWFFPALSSLTKGSARNGTLSVSYVGHEAHSGHYVEHIYFVVQFPAPATTAPPPTTTPGEKGPPHVRPSISPLTAIDMYLDAATFLPTAVKFKTHPDNNALMNIPVEIDFSNYQPVNGIAVPMHIQKFLNGTLFLDITIQSASINTGVPSAGFTVQ